MDRKIPTQQLRLFGITEMRGCFVVVVVVVFGGDNFQFKAAHTVFKTVVVHVLRDF